MAHLAAILFFSALLVALGLILETIVKASRAEIAAAFRGVPRAPARAPAPAARTAKAALGRPAAA